MNYVTELAMISCLVFCSLQNITDLCTEIDRIEYYVGFFRNRMSTNLPFLFPTSFPLNVPTSRFVQWDCDTWPSSMRTIT